MDHALDVAVVSQFQVVAEVADETLHGADFFLDLVGLLGKHQAILAEVSCRRDTSYKQTGALNQLSLMLPLVVLLFRNLHQLNYDINQVLIFVVDKLQCAFIVILNDQRQCEEKQVDILCAKVHLFDNLLLLLVIVLI